MPFGAVRGRAEREVAAAKRRAKVLRGAVAMAAPTDTLLLAWQRDAPGLEDSGALASVVAPAWVVALAGAGVVLCGLFYFAWRLRRARKTTRYSHSTVRRG